MIVKHTALNLITCLTRLSELLSVVMYKKVACIFMISKREIEIVEKRKLRSLENRNESIK